MARYLLEKHPEVLLGGDCLPAGELRCEQFWEKFKSYQPSHLVYKHHKDRLHQVIPVCLHGDKGRTLKKSPIACYSWESVWGLPPNLRHTNDESQLKKKTEQKYDTGRLGQTCSERPGWTKGEIAAGQCTIKRRRLSYGSDERIQTHNSLGYLAQYIFSKPGMQCVLCVFYTYFIYIYIVYNTCLRYVYFMFISYIYVGELYTIYEIINIHPSQLCFPWTVYHPIILNQERMGTLNLLHDIMYVI